MSPLFYKNNVFKILLKHQSLNITTAATSKVHMLIESRISLKLNLRFLIRQIKSFDISW